MHFNTHFSCLPDDTFDFFKLKGEQSAYGTITEMSVYYLHGWARCGFNSPLVQLRVSLSVSACLDI